MAQKVFAGLLDDTLEVQLRAGPITVVSRAALMQMKRLAGRTQDLADLEKLEAERDE